MATHQHQHPRVDAPKRATYLMARIWVLLFSSALCGCAGWQDLKYEQSQRFRSITSYFGSSHPGAGRYRSDYRAGWIDGHYAALTGGGNVEPAVPPARYWNPKYEYRDGNAKRDAYYQGWRAGAAQGSRTRDGHYIHLQESSRLAADCSYGSCEVLLSSPMSSQGQGGEVIVDSIQWTPGTANPTSEFEREVSITPTPAFVDTNSGTSK